MVGLKLFPRTDPGFSLSFATAVMERRGHWMVSLAALSLTVTARTLSGNISRTARDKLLPLTGPLSLGLVSSRPGRTSHLSSSDTDNRKMRTVSEFCRHVTWLEDITGNSHVCQNIKILTCRQDRLYVRTGVFTLDL